jgi:hypothetical protein
MSKSGGKARMRVTYCGKCDRTDMIKKSSGFDAQGVVLFINRRMIETWYVVQGSDKVRG